VSPRNIEELSRHLFVERPRAGAARRTASALAEFADVDLQFINRAAQGVAVHAELPGGAALVAFILFEDGCNKTALKLTYRFGIENVAAVHVLHESH